jgi:hypothetical protein
MTNPLQKDKECTALRAKAFASLFGGPPASVFPPHALLQRPEERFLIDIFVYTLRAGTRAVEVAVTNGMSDQTMADADDPQGRSRRELIYGPSGDVKWDEADPTYSVEAARRSG